MESSDTDVVDQKVVLVRGLNVCVGPGLEILAIAQTVIDGITEELCWELIPFLNGQQPTGQKKEHIETQLAKLEQAPATTSQGDRRRIAINLVRDAMASGPQIAIDKAIATQRSFSDQGMSYLLRAAQRRISQDLEKLF